MSVMNAPSACRPQEKVPETAIYRRVRVNKVSHIAVRDPILKHHIFVVECLHW